MNKLSIPYGSSGYGSSGYGGSIVPEWLQNQVKDAFKSISITQTSETPYLPIWTGDKFNPFNFTSATKLQEITVKLS